MYLTPYLVHTPHLYPSGSFSVYKMIFLVCQSVLNVDVYLVCLVDVADAYINISLGMSQLSTQEDTAIDK